MFCFPIQERLKSQLFMRCPCDLIRRKNEHPLPRISYQTTFTINVTTTWPFNIFYAVLTLNMLYIFVTGVLSTVLFICSNIPADFLFDSCYMPVSLSLPLLLPLSLSVSLSFPNESYMTRSINLKSTSEMVSNVNVLIYRLKGIKNFQFITWFLMLEFSKLKTHLFIFCDDSFRIE